MYEFYYPRAKFSPPPIWKNHRLRLEQQLICDESKVACSLEKLLLKINSEATHNWSVPKGCLIRHICTKEENRNEEWIKNFLDKLREHLRSAGVNVLENEKYNLPEISGSIDHIYQYRKKVEKIDWTIIVSTVSSFQKIETDDFYHKLILTNCERQHYQVKTLFILLGSAFEKELPAYLFTDAIIVDWHERSYVTNLKELLAKIYGVHPDEQNYNDIWKSFEDQYPSLIRKLTKEVVNKQIEEEKNLERERNEFEKQQLEGLLLHLNQRSREVNSGELRSPIVITSQSSNSSFSEPHVKLADTEIKIKSKVNRIWSLLVGCTKEKYKEFEQIKTSFRIPPPQIEFCAPKLEFLIEKEELIKREENFTNDSANRKDRLNNYEKLHQKGNLSLLEEIFGSHHNDKSDYLVLIFGRAGIGKSVLCHNLAYQWAKGQWAEELFELVIWIPFCTLLEENSFFWREKKISIGKIFYEQYKEQLQESSLFDKKKWIEHINTLTKKNSSKILYILDGLDEMILIEEREKKLSTWRPKLIRKLLNQKRVIITSRPHYINEYLVFPRSKKVHQLEHIGFLDVDIFNYIANYSWKNSQQSEVLIHLIKESLNFRGIAHVPFHLELICYQWRKMDLENLNLINLFESLLADLLYYRLGKQGNVKFKDRNISAILKNETVQSVFNFLGEIALSLMRNNTLIIKENLIDSLMSKDLFNILNGNFKQLIRIGLLIPLADCAEFLEERKERYFIHLIFQEFLAAHRIANLFEYQLKTTGKVVLMDHEALKGKSIQKSLNEFVDEQEKNADHEAIWEIVGELIRNITEDDHTSLIPSFLKCYQPRNLRKILNEEVKEDIEEDVKEIVREFKCLIL